MRRAAEADLDGEIRRRARATALEASEGLTAAQRALEPPAAAAASLPQLVAVVAQHDQATLQDQLSTEPPFGPIRQDFPVFGVLTDGPDEVLHGASRAELHADRFFAEARQKGAPTSAVLLLKEKPYLAAAAPVHGPPRPGSTEPGPAMGVVVVAKPLAEAVFDGLAARVTGAVLLSDGTHALGAAGAPEARAALSQLLGREGAREVVDPGMSWGASAAPVGPGLWLWTAIDTSAFAAPVLASQQTTRIAVWAVVAVAALGLLLTGFRGGGTQAPAPASNPAMPAPTSAPDDDGLGRTQVSISKPDVAAATPPPGGARPIPLTQPAGGPSASFGRYLLVDLLGSGGMGDVYLAVAFGAEGFRRNFVIKRLRPELARDPVLVTHFIDEARLSSSLVHSNVIPVFDFGKVGDEYFMAQEYIDGRDLEQLTRRSLEVDGRPLPPHLLFYAAHQVLAALSYAHAKADDAGRPLQLVHRDVSPQNVMVSARGEVKLFDFGIVKSTARSTQTEAGVVKGNVSFMAPEQARGLPLDGRADLFSLGLVLYRCLSGEMLYRDETAYQLLVHAATGPGQADLPRIGNLPAPAPAVLARALAVEPAQRFANAAEFAAALPAPRGTDGAELGALVQRLFGPELERERAKLAAATPDAAPGRGVGT
jgi:hypothetical protein